MGKNKTKRFGNLRPNPTGLTSERNLELEAELHGDPSQNVPSAISSITEKLQAPGTEERVCGCELLANIVAQPRAIGHLLNENIIKITAPLFLDSCLDVRKGALGALRNLSVYGGEDVCEIMVTNDIVTPLAALIKQYNSEWVPPKEAVRYDTSTKVLVEAVELLSNLCESSSTAVKWFNKEGLLSVLLPILSIKQSGYSLSIPIARCLHVVSENNPAVSSVCQQPDVLAQFLSMVSSAPTGIDGVLLRTLVTGILLNLSEVDLSAYYDGIVATILEVLDMNISTVIETALQKTDQKQNESFENDPTWPDVDKLISAQGISLELLANLCCSDDEWEDMEGQGSEESSDDQTMSTCGETVDMTGDIKDTMCLPSEVKSAFMEKDVLSKILQKTCSLNPDYVSNLEVSQCGKSTLKRLQDLQSRALLCLSNVVAVMEESHLKQTSSLMSIWTDLYKLASSSQDEDFRWAVTSAMRAVIQRMAELNVLNLADASETDLMFLIGLAKDSKNRETQINVVRILSTMGCVLSLGLEPHPLLKNIGTILLEVAANNKDLVVVAEALDSLFDVFKEDHTDPVVKEIGLVEKLKAMQPSFKTAVSQQRKKLGENYAVVMMAKSNLSGYIKYKQTCK